MVMELSSQAAPGAEKAAGQQAVESVCHLAGTAGSTDWSAAAAELFRDASDRALLLRVSLAGVEDITEATAQ
jgi:hypothetical protein